MKIKPSNIKIWSQIGTRASFGMAALELGANQQNLIIISGDTSTSAGLERFKKKYPEKYFEVGIAEQNMIGIAAGLSSEGHKVITTTFAPFQTMRCLEQIKVNLGYMKHKVVMVGLASGLIQGMLGFTHCCIEDISVMRSIPGITVISPADSFATVKATLAAMEHHQSVYLRLTGATPNPPVYKNDFELRIGKSNTIIDYGHNVAIISCGSMVSNSIKVAHLLKRRKIESCVVDMHTIKPIDKDALKKINKNYKLLVTIEEHSLMGGLGSAVAEYISSLEKSIPVLSIGIPDFYETAGSYTELLSKYMLNPQQITEKIVQRYTSLYL